MTTICHSKVGGLKKELQELISMQSSRIEAPCTFKPSIPLVLANTNSKKIKDYSEKLKDVEFVQNKNKSVVSKRMLSDIKIDICGFTFKSGLGGVHSNQKAVGYTSADGEIYEIDVDSYYPSILNNNPKFVGFLGDKFINLYYEVFLAKFKYEKILKANEKFKKVKRDQIEEIQEFFQQDLEDDKLHLAKEIEKCKLILNATCGSFYDKRSPIYSPSTYINLVFCGQLYMIFLLVAFEARNIKVLSVNTDSVTVQTKSKELMDEIIDKWSKKFKFSTSCEKYKIICYNNVNSYIAIKEDKSLKLKGAFVLDFEKLGNFPIICTKAIINWLLYKKPITDTIKGRNNSFRDYMGRSNNTNVATKCHHNNKRTLWYYAKEDHLKKTYCVESYLDRAAKLVQPCKAHKNTVNMELIPDNLNYENYIEETYRKMEDSGIVV